MKSASKSIVIIIVSFLVVTIYQACGSRCKGLDGLFRIDSISGKAVIITGIDTTKSYGIKYYTVDNYQGLQVRYDSLGFNFQTTEVFVAMDEPMHIGFSEANACDPAVNREYIQNLKIISNKDYTPLYPAGKDLSEIFVVSNNNAVKTESIGYLGGVHNVSGPSFLMKLIVGPAENITHDLTFTFEVTGGRKLTTQVLNVLITK